MGRDIRRGDFRAAQAATSSRQQLANDTPRTCNDANANWLIGRCYGTTISVDNCASRKRKKRAGDKSQGY